MTMPTRSSTLMARRRRPRLVHAVLAMLVAAASVGTFAQHAAQAAPVTAVRGSACGYQSSIGLFGSPLMLRGCVESSGGGAASLSPSVALPAGGSATPITATDLDGAKARFGPATVFGGVFLDGQGFDKPSGPIDVSTQGTAASGTVTSSVNFKLFDPPVPAAPGGFGPSPVEGKGLHVECAADASGAQGSTTITEGTLSTATDAGGDPTTQEPIPTNPPPNYTRSGAITNVGDVFTVVLNEHIVNADGSLTVNASHLYLFGPTAVGQQIVGQVTCGTTPSAIAATDTQPPACGLPDIEPNGPEDPTPIKPLTVLIGLFDTGGLQSITDPQATNGTIQVGKSTGEDYLRFLPGQTGPLAITVTRDPAAEAANLPMSFSFTATDVAGNATPVSVQIAIAAGGGATATATCGRLSAALTAVDDAYFGPPGAPLTIDAPRGVLSNDTGPATGSLVASGATVPAKGAVTLNADGSFTYTPKPNTSGADTFKYTVGDTVATATATVTITLADNAPPVAVDDPGTGDLPYSVTKNKAKTIPALAGVLRNDTDPDNDTLTAAVATQPAHGAVEVRPDGSFTYTPTTDFVGTDTFTYTASDGRGGTDTATVTVQVAAAGGGGGDNKLTVSLKASPASRPPPGGTFTFDMLITNTSSAALSVTTLTDSVVGDLVGRGTCTLPPGPIPASPATNNTYSCSYSADFSGNAGASRTSKVTAVAGALSATGEATVTITGQAAFDTPTNPGDGGTLGAAVADTGQLLARSGSYLLRQLWFAVVLAALGTALTVHANRRLQQLRRPTQITRLW